VALEYLMTPVYSRYVHSLSMVESRCAARHWVAVTCCAGGRGQIHPSINDVSLDFLY
jgi:hypothetical protein